MFDILLFPPHSQFPQLWVSFFSFFFKITHMEMRKREKKY